MTQLSQQMQGKMEQTLKSARIDTMLNTIKSAMIDAAKRIEQRPSLEGCDALEFTQSHSLIQNSKGESS